MFEQVAYAAPTQSAAADVNPIMGFMPMIFIFVIFYFFLIRPQQKRQKELQKMIDNLKKGDRVTTAGGIIGTISSIQNDYLVIKVGEGENTKLEVLKNSITGIRS